MVASAVSISAKVSSTCLASCSPRSLSPRISPKQPQRRRGRLEAAVDQHVGDLGLLLHVVGERDVGVAHGAEVEDQVGLRLEHHLEIGGAAVTRQPAQRRQVAILRGDVGPLFRRRRIGPARHLLRRQHVDEDRGRRPSGEHALDLVGHLDLAPGRVGDGARLGCRRRVTTSRSARNRFASRAAALQPASCRRRVFDTTEHPRTPASLVMKTRGVGGTSPNGVRGWPRSRSDGSVTRMCCLSQCRTPLPGPKPCFTRIDCPSSPRMKWASRVAGIGASLRTIIP